VDQPGEGDLGREVHKVTTGEGHVPVLGDEDQVGMKRENTIPVSAEAYVTAGNQIY
jgi:hypothetical protein